MMRGMWAVLAMAVVGLAFGACTFETVPIPPECNGAVELCDRRYDQVSFPMTHNAMSSEEDGFVNPNQYRTIEHQLEDGIRGMMIDTYEYMGDTYMCHLFCQAGKRRLVDGLTVIRKFLDQHPGEVMTFILESHITPDQTAAAFKDSGLDKYVHVHVPGTPWPTLRELIDADERLVVMTEAGGGLLDWFMDVWALTWETPYHFEALSQFTCLPNRGIVGNPLFLLNHFLTVSFAVPEQAEMVNSTLLMERARKCKEEAGQLPNFVAVDFYSVGSLFEVTRMLNELP
jgi:hypothetical protein